VHCVSVLLHRVHFAATVRQSTGAPLAKLEGWAIQFDKLTVVAWGAGLLNFGEGGHQMVAIMAPSGVRSLSVSRVM
jgi:hypothetical protein